MAKANTPLVDTSKLKPLAYSKRTIKKSGGDDFINNVKCVRMKSKRRKRKTIK